MIRKPLKEYAAKKYGEEYICSVGNWITYKPKSAIQDICKTFGGNMSEAIKLTTSLPDDFDGMSLADLVKVRREFKIAEKKNKTGDIEEKEFKKASREYEKFSAFFEYARHNSEIIKYAYRLVGMIKSAGTHAGGLIISSKKLKNIVPMFKSKIAGWTSQWTEGRSTQMSKFGLVKFDILGLKTMQYIWQCCNLIESNRGVKFDWSDMDPEADRLGWEIFGDDKKEIKIDDPESMEAINDLRTESVFQHETSIQKGIIKDGKVKNFHDMTVYSALGRPGPMDAIPDYYKNRDDKKQRWKEGMDPNILKILEDTYGVICYQEQLTALWVIMAHFTAPQAEESRKIISKKWLDKLPGVKKRWFNGATKIIGKEQAEEWWTKMETFGRYCFNRAHAVAYSILSFRCLYLKTHYPTEWWASVMSYCHPDKLKKYMSVARLDGVEFSEINCNNLTVDFTVDGDSVRPGLTSIKGVGEKAAERLSSLDGPFATVEEFVEKCGKAKSVMERIIKLGAFDEIEPNRKGLWEWYRYKFCAGPEISQLRKEINARFAWSEEDLQKERNRQAKAYFEIYPNRKKIPNKILNWKPKIGWMHDTPSLRQIVDSCEGMYSLEEQLEYQKEYLGYYWHSPMHLYKTGEDTSICEASESGELEIIIDKIVQKDSRQGERYVVLNVSDGMQSSKVVIWSDMYGAIDSDILREGSGYRMSVSWSSKFENFTLTSPDISKLRKTHGND